MTSRWTLACAIAGILALGGCKGGGDAGGAGGSAGSGGNAGDGGSGGNALCDSVTCDDGNACTVDRCDEADGSCVYEPIVTSACRTRIDIEFPARGATLVGSGGSPTVTVTGEVGSGLGAVTSLAVNGTPVSFGEDGSFSHDVTARVGGNTLIVEAEDETGNARTRVQSFLWSTGYLMPTAPPEDMASQGLGIWLSQQALDDGAAPPPQDFADILGVVVQSLDLSGLFDSGTPVASSTGYDIYVTSLSVGGTSVTLSAFDGGVDLRATLSGVSGDLLFDCTEFGCVLLGGDSTGDYSIDSVVVNADVILSVSPSHALEVTLQNVQSNVNGLDISSDNGWTDFLITIIEPVIRSLLVGDLESSLSDAVSDELAPLLEDGLGALAFNFALDLPTLGGGEPIVVDVTSDFESADFTASPQGGALIERGGAYTSTTVAPYMNLGVPNRDGCGAGGQAIAFPRSSIVEIGLSDDLLNQVLYAAWRGGWLEIADASELVASPALLALGITDLELGLSGWLAPTVSDCNDDGVLRVHVGDIEIRGSMQRDGRPLTFTAFATLGGEVSLEAVEGGLGIGITSVDLAEVEVTIVEDDQLDAETLLRTLILNALSSTIEDPLGSGGLGTLPIPEVDLSAALGVAPGTAVLRVTPETLDRVGGVTVIGGSL